MVDMGTEKQEVDVTFSRKQMELLERVLDRSTFLYVNALAGGYSVPVEPETLSKLNMAKKTLNVSLMSKLCGIGSITMAHALKGCKVSARTREALEGLVRLVEFIEKELGYNFDVPETDPEPQAGESSASYNSGTPQQVEQ